MPRTVAGALIIGRARFWAAVAVCVCLLAAPGSAAAAGGSPAFTKLGDAVGADPYYVAVGDFTGNGTPDLAVTNDANYGSGTVSILLGNGNGTFDRAGGSPITVGSQPHQVAVGDFNGDGIPDLAVANGGSDTVSVLLGNGDGTFTQASDSPITVGDFPYGVAVADLNGDGIPDLAVTNYDSGTVSILLGNGNGTFTQAPDSPITVGSQPHQVAVGDFNGDGIPDLAVANGGSDTVSVLLGNGDGTFTQASDSPITVGDFPFGVAVGNFNGDGIPDLAVANLYANTVSILLGNGNGTFTQASGSPITVGSQPSWVAVGDLNGDGIPDLAVANQGLNPGTVSVLLGNGNGTFTQASPITLGSYPLGVAVGDFNGDGLPDLAVTNNGSGTVSVLLNASRPLVSPSPASLAFVPGVLGTPTGSEVVSIADTGAAPLSVSGLSLIGQDADEFRVTGDGCTGQTVLAGASCSVGVVFSPTRPGPAVAQLRIASNALGGISLVGLSGAGLSPGVAGLSFPVAADPVFAAGLDANGQLGGGGTVNALSPVALAPGSGSFVQVSAGGSHSLGLEANGTVWTWGANGSGQLGDGGTIDSHAPVQVPLPSGMIAVSAGLSHSLALRSDGTVWAWGSNAYGQLGNGTTNSSSTPVEVPGLTNVVAIAAGGYHSLALRSDGTVWAWGSNAHGELGNDGLVNSSVPVQVSTISGVVAIAAGQYHSLALTSAGKVYAWGLGSDGQVGDGLFSSSAVPQAVSGLSSGVTAIAAGADHSLALLSAGTVDAWGDDSNGQLGNASTTNIDAPVAVSGLTGAREIAAGSLYSLAVSGSGQAYAWGQNNDGQLGIGSTTDAHTATLMSSVGNGAQALAQGSEGNHTLLIAQPYATLNPATGPIAFTAPGVGQSSTSLTETVTDSGLVPLVFGQAAITGQDGDEFAITGDGCSNTTLAPGGSCVIGLRYTEKVNETSPVATLRIPSNSPTSPNTISLDPPAHAAAVTCSTRRTTPTRLIVTCHLNPTLPKGRRRIQITLTHHASATVTTSRRTISATLRLPHGLRAGSYHLTITTGNPVTRTSQTVRLGPTARLG